jgi:hypothetical protein
MVPRILTWMDGLYDTTWTMTRAYRYRISWPFRQVIDAICLYNGEQHCCFEDRFRPSNTAVTIQSLTLPQCRPNLESHAKTK